ncbi:hypothetical protein [Tateyamaria sp. syn59]|uniref:hypothetical protein n=1 Tax=Tateyamaria sp. syn59 TaxID=2576942 RepID=UPI0011BD7377|nr:hypothetical protein [Tateyamaria sp. syn59]
MYGWLYRSSIYLAFLRHLKWMWTTMLRVPVLAPFVVGSVILTWVAVPIIIAFFLLLVLTLLLHSTDFLDMLPLFVFGYVIAVAPIVLSATVIFFDGLLSAAKVWSGNPDAARARLSSVVRDLEQRGAGQ